MPEIKLEHVTKRFEKFVAVDDLNLHIDEHDFITLLGILTSYSLVYACSRELVHQQIDGQNRHDDEKIQGIRTLVAPDLPVFQQCGHEVDRSR